jgi:hypothetical protein
MENRAYEDEANKSAHHHHHHHPQPQVNKNQNHAQHPQLDKFSFDRVQMSEGNRQHQQQQLMQSRHTPDCHVYEDIVAPYGLALDPGGPGGFHRNLTLPLRWTSQSCESIEGNPTSSSVRVTNKERTRGSVIDRLTRDDRYRYESRDFVASCSNMVYGARGQFAPLKLSSISALSALFSRSDRHIQTIFLCSIKLLSA